jgi:hypothetical protein
VSVDETVLRAQQDWKAGRRKLARQRLRGLVGSLPQRLDLRERLAEMYRADGDAAQAGRWGYLGEQRSDGEAAAFEKAYAGDPVEMMRALGWRGPEDAAGQTAQQRLQQLRARAEREVGGPVTWEAPRWPDLPKRWWQTALLIAGCLVLLVVGGLVLVGAGALAVHGLSVLRGWLP